MELTSLNEDKENSDAFKVCGIEVKNLFGSINNKFKIDDSYNVSILSAPNGCGKTTTFKLLMFILAPSIETLKEISSIPFDTFSCKLSNEITLSISRVVIDMTHKREQKNGNFAIDIAKIIFKENIDFVYCIEGKNVKNGRLSFIEMPVTSTLSRMECLFGDEELEETYYRTGWGGKRTLYLYETFVKEYINRINENLINNQCHIGIDFIEANRLQKISLRPESRNPVVRDNYERMGGRDREIQKTDYLINANDEIASKIQISLGEYNKRLTEAKNKLPKMYIDFSSAEEQDYSSFKDRWNKYHSELNKFYEIGFLDSADTVIQAPELEEAFTKKASFLKIYLDAFESTLEPLQKDYEKNKLLIDIFNKRNEITNKKLRLTQYGIEIHSGEKKIEIEWLSSGEKNDFVMFYRLIFKTEKNGIVLIDEPEISLHIEWQEEYLDRLMDICKMNGIQAIVATHSPNIINGHLELFIYKG